MAKQRMKYVYETILPTIRKTGKFDLKQQPSCSTDVINYDKKLADARMEVLQLKLENTQAIAKYEARVTELIQNAAKYDTTISEMKRNYERQMSEYKEREYKMQLQMKDLTS
ncbi:Bro15 [Heliothis virescens ascovirus 3e]|uniref:Bro15 n=1 Tax=Heliothis virescens ascovirus 3e TaxID=260797 RepID=A4KXH9_HVAVE|nr:Bro15 [Heliothis virescens ascovirus 3e]ABO37310.1 Bro15 [Heliothis virescens ascovirus 3e]